MSDNFDEVFSTASHMMKSRQDPLPQEDPSEDFFPGEEIPGEFEDGPSEEELLLAQKTASADWRKEKEAGTMALSEEDYVTGKTQCTPEEFRTRRKILEDLNLSVKEQINYNDVPEDVLEAMASLAPEEQEALAGDLKAGKVKAKILTLPQVQGYRRGVSVWDRPEDEPKPEEVSESDPEPAESSAPDEPESLLTTEEVPDPESPKNPPENPESSVSDLQKESLRKAKEKDLKIVEELAQDYDREHPKQAEPDEPEDESSKPAEPEPVSPAPAAESKPDIPSAVEEIAADGELEEKPESSESSSGETDESQIRGLMYRDSLDPLLDTMQDYVTRVRKTAGSAVTETDYQNMMADVETLQRGLTGLFDYYLNHALDTVPEELLEENGSEDPEEPEPPKAPESPESQDGETESAD